jgi:hypothetical protein
MEGLVFLVGAGEVNLNGVELLSQLFLKLDGVGVGEQLGG